MSPASRSSDDVDVRQHRLRALAREGASGTSVNLLTGRRQRRAGRAVT
jgi:hypothetical protein